MDQQVFKKISIFLILFFSFFNVLYAQNKFDDKILSDVEYYLNNIKYFKANFIQDDLINSQLSEGEFYLSRPGKLRVDYKNPFEASLYSDFRSTIYYDKELDEITSVRTASTPLYFLVKSNLKFKNNSFSIVDFKNNKDYIEVSFKEKNKEEQGLLILKFKKNPITLNSIKLINSLNQEIEMNLFKISTNPIKNSIFNFKRIKSK